MNYWTSSQRLQWQLSKAQIKAAHAADAAQYGLKTYSHIRIYLYNAIVQLARRLHVRQQAVGAAAIFLSRFYAKAALSETDPHLVLTTCLYLACKTVECPQHIRVVVNEARGLWPDRITSDVEKLAECEFYLIEELDTCLIVHQPDSSFPFISEYFQLSAQDGQIVWSVINDTYVTDLTLLWPPHILAIAAFMVAILTPIPSISALRRPQSDLRRKVIEFVAQSSIDMDGITDCIQTLVSLYDIWQTYDAKRIKELL